MAQALIEVAKRSNLETLGYSLVHGGSFVTIGCELTGDEEMINLGDDLLVFFALGIIMERRRAEKEAETKTKRTAKKTSTRETSDV